MYNDYKTRERRYLWRSLTAFGRLMTTLLLLDD